MYEIKIIMHCKIDSIKTKYNNFQHPIDKILRRKLFLNIQYKCNVLKSQAKLLI